MGTAAEARGGRARDPLPAGNETGGIDDYLARNRTTGLLIVAGDTILVERYQYDRTAAHRMTSFSMAKTVVAMLVGIAIAEGGIRSIDDRAEASTSRSSRARRTARRASATC